MRGCCCSASIPELMVWSLQWKWHIVAMHIVGGKNPSTMLGKSSLNVGLNTFGEMLLTKTLSLFPQQTYTQCKIYVCKYIWSQRPSMFLRRLPQPGSNGCCGFFRLSSEDASHRDWRNVRKNNLQNMAKEPKKPTTTIRSRLWKPSRILSFSVVRKYLKSWDHSAHSSGSWGAPLLASRIVQ